MSKAILLAALAFALVRAQETDEQCPVNIPGVKHHGNCNLFCRPASWSDLLVFYLGNYATHAATITSRPGQSILSTLLTIIAALLFPGGGVHAGIQAIFSTATLGDTDLKVAARAGALCAVVKTRDVLGPLEPDDDVEVERTATGDGGDVPQLRGQPEPTGGDPPEPAIEMLERGRQEGLQPKPDPPRLLETKVHGLCRLPEGYELVVVPRTAEFDWDDASVAARLPVHARFVKWLTGFFRPEEAPHTVLSCNYNVIKILVSVAQLGIAVTTLYRTQGDQIKVYGYAAFGLTVAPYAWMSLVNLAGNLMCPQYNTMFVVESSGLDHLREDVARDRARRMASRRQEAGAEAGSVAAPLHEASRGVHGKHEVTDGELSDRFMVTGTVGRLTAKGEADVNALFKDAHEGSQRRLMTDIHATWNSTRDVFIFLASFYVSVVPIAIVGGLSRFAPGQSATYQRVWTVMWLVLGAVVGNGLRPMSDAIEGRPILGSTMRHHRTAIFWYSIIGVMAVYAVLPIGGYVVVGQMIRDFGVCYEFKTPGSADSS
ncbi:metallophosphoesterase [Purpureocillium lavendulum]|uniref:Metallophosphoesterase n=1 Tax=Purpureocillium lavendulum TaxID=1247861 RepID=A0AB34FW43_9HYPO|nr:metallophosphoesterase [Purpureocillium lavendulum]